jgi:hypothetical protein
MSASSLNSGGTQKDQPFVASSRRILLAWYLDALFPSFFLLQNKSRYGHPLPVCPRFASAVYRVVERTKRAPDSVERSSHPGCRASDLPQNGLGTTTTPRINSPSLARPVALWTTTPARSTSSPTPRARRHRALSTEEKQTPRLGTPEARNHSIRGVGADQTRQEDCQAEAKAGGQPEAGRWRGSALRWCYSEGTSSLSSEGEP